LIFYLFFFAIFMTSLGVLVPTFVPKLLALEDERREKIEREKRITARQTRLEIYDRLRTQNEESKAELTPVVEESDESVTSNLDDKKGLEIRASSKEQNEQLQTALAEVMTENLSLKKSISLSRNMIKSVRASQVT